MDATRDATREALAQSRNATWQKWAAKKLAATGMSADSMEANTMDMIQSELNTKIHGFNIRLKEVDDEMIRNVSVKRNETEAIDYLTLWRRHNRMRINEIIGEEFDDEIRREILLSTLDLLYLS